jgi:hypothetical protein
VSLFAIDASKVRLTLFALAARQGVSLLQQRANKVRLIPFVPIASKQARSPSLTAIGSFCHLAALLELISI